MRALVKRSWESALSSPAVGWVTQRRVRAKRLILAYHGIIPEGARPAGEPGLFIRQRDFASQLDVLVAEAEVVALDRLDDEGGARPRVAITIDDAYRGAVTVAVGELAARSLPATIFVAPARLNNHVFWWDALLHGSAKRDRAIRNHALYVLGGADERVRAWAAEEGITTCELPEYAQTATEAEIAAALRHAGITLGSHSWSHPNLASLDSTQLATELCRSREWLYTTFGERVIDWLAYPYGIESVQARAAAADAGYEGALRIGGGWHRATDVSRFVRPRFSIASGLSVAGFRARLHGALLQ